jgi:hypothetical protein
MAARQACVACLCALLLGTATGRVTPEFAGAREVLARSLPTPSVSERDYLPASGCCCAKRVAVRSLGVCASVGFPFVTGVAHTGAPWQGCFASVPPSPWRLPIFSDGELPATWHGFGIRFT